MSEADDCQAGKFLKNITTDVIHSFDLQPNQIYSVTSDNDRNMMKVAELLKGEFDVFDYDEENVVDEEIDCDKKMEILNSNAKQGLETLTNSYSNIIHLNV